MPMMKVGPGRTLFGGRGAYSLDGIAGIAMALSIRRLRSDYVGPCLRLRRDSDDAESDFGFFRNGDLNISLIENWLGGAIGYVRTWYDQSGNARHAEQATANRQPQYAATAHSGRPALLYQNAALALITSSFPHFPGKRGGLSIVLHNSIDTAYAIATFSQASPDWIFYTTATGGAIHKWYDGVENRAADTYDTTSTVQQHTLMRDSDTTVAYWRDGQLLAAPTTIVDNQPADNPLFVGAATPLTAGVAGHYFEAIEFSVDLSTDDRQSIERSQRSYYSIA